MTARFIHRKRWGADPLEGANVRFRIWAPEAADLSLVYGNDDAIPMQPRADGWFELVTDRVAPGECYAFRLPDGRMVPDPAARAQVGDVHGASELVDPRSYPWRTGAWKGRPWEEAVIYELHPGTFSPEGTFKGIENRLDHLLETGITVLELMPVAQFAGNRGWGYDGVLLYAPHRAYGGPDGLKALVDAAHEYGLMILLDVVYNHFGPDGNYLHRYASDFFHAERETPWGGAIAYDRPAVRDFIVDNALYWLEEYRLDGLRLDAINQIEDPSPEHILDTIAKRVRNCITDRAIHLTTEDDRNITRLHERDATGAVALYTAEWNDDFHHAVHYIATAETEGYYVDYATMSVSKLARALTEGFIYQGEVSRFWGNATRGRPSKHLPPVAFVNFIQNHDQIGNRAFNERLTDLAPARIVEAMTAILLLAPHIPMLFMGEEWGETNPFGFFTDFHGDLARAVREGRRREFRRFARFADEANREKIPDPNAEGTFLSSCIDWSRPDEPAGRERHELVKRLLRIRRHEIVPRLSGMQSHDGAESFIEGRAIGVRWHLGDGATLFLLANLGDAPAVAPMKPNGRVLYETVIGIAERAESGSLPAWAVAVLLDDSNRTARLDAEEAA